MRRLLKRANWSERGSLFWLTFMVVLLLVNVPAWVGNWWYVPAMLAYVGVIVLHAHTWGYGKATKLWRPIAEDQLKALKELKDQHPVQIHYVVLIQAGETGHAIQRIEGIGVPVSLN